MRRREKEIQNREVIEELLRSAPVCRLGLAPGLDSQGHGGTTAGRPRADAPKASYPYVVPVHFVHAEGRIYIHSARAGKKISMLGENSRVCVEIDEFLGLKSADKACDYGTRFRSLIAFGRARIVEEAEDKLRALQLLMGKYAGRSFDFSQRSIQGVTVIEIRIEELTGKQDLGLS
jgi:nitroimidazol reductase NimA-like FMN-containing flavoprotein (pyridoxamine 5'-phosphate oxidase superfamily)